MTDYNISLLSPSHPNSHVGVYGATGGEVTFGALAADYDLPNTYVILCIGQGGTIVFEDYDGVIWARYGVLDGTLILTRARKILVSGIVNGTLRSTTCELITWETPANLVQES